MRNDGYGDMKWRAYHKKTPGIAFSLTGTLDEISQQLQARKQSA